MFLAALVVAVVALSALADKGVRTRQIAVGVVTEVQAGKWLTVVNEPTDRRGRTFLLSETTTYEAGEQGAAIDASAITPGGRVVLWYKSAAERRPVVSRVRVLPDAPSR